jgi:5'-3' exonuclease
LKTKLGAIALTLPIALATLTGCSMTDTKNSDDIPSSGVSTSSDAAEGAKKTSSELYNLIGLKGKASDTGPGVKECGKRDPEKYFQIFHSWSFTPTSSEQLDGAMEQLKSKLPKHGWEVVEYGPDSSRNKNLSLTADNDTKKFSVKITYQAKDNPSNLSFFVVSGCYQVPDGQKIEQF